MHVKPQILNGFKQVQIAYLTVISYLDIDTTNFRVNIIQTIFVCKELISSLAS